MSKVHYQNTDAPAGDKECQIMVYNVQKSANIGNIVRSAVAFGASTVIVVGERKINTFGNQGTTSYIRFSHYPDVISACTHLRQRGFNIIGVEIGADAKDVTTHPFTGPTVFMLGNEGSGLSEKQKKLCDSLVYIPQYGKGTASLNVSNAAAIILHHYATWANYQQTEIVGEKFHVQEDNKIKFTRKDPDAPYEYSEYELKIREERKAKKMQLEAEAQAAAEAQANGEVSTQNNNNSTNSTTDIVQ